MHDEINDFDCDGYRPIHHAVLANSQERALDLMRLGALINAPSESGEGILVLACRALRDTEAKEWIPFLLKAGAEIIDTDLAGWSALHHAVDRGMILTVKELMSAGADPFLKAKNGVRPVDLAKDEGLKVLLKP